MKKFIYFVLVVVCIGVTLSPAIALQASSSAIQGASVDLLAELVIRLGLANAISVIFIFISCCLWAWILKQYSNRELVIEKITISHSDSIKTLSLSIEKLANNHNIAINKIIDDNKEERDYIIQQLFKH